MKETNEECCAAREATAFEELVHNFSSDIGGLRVSNNNLRYVTDRLLGSEPDSIDDQKEYDPGNILSVLQVLHSKLRQEIRDLDYTVSRLNNSI